MGTWDPGRNGCRRWELRSRMGSEPRCGWERVGASAQFWLEGSWIQAGEQSVQSWYRMCITKVERDLTPTRKTEATEYSQQRASKRGGFVNPYKG